MKKLILVLVILMSVTVNSQHEVKVDVFDLLAFETLDLTYQYNLNEEMAVGISVFNNLSDKDNVFNDREQFTITPYYRQYLPFGGLGTIYIEGFLAINSGEDIVSVIDPLGDAVDEFGNLIDVFIDKKIDYTDVAFGFTLGKSFRTPRGFVLDIYAGLGRNLLDDEGSPSVVPRIGINTGFKF